MLVDSRWNCKITDYGLHKFKQVPIKQPSNDPFIEGKIYEGKFPLPGYCMRSIFTDTAIKRSRLNMYYCSKAFSLPPGLAVAERELFYLHAICNRMQ